MNAYHIGKLVGEHYIGGERVTNNHVADRFGNIPYACFMFNDQVIAMTEDDYKQARAIGQACRCNNCICCEALRYVKEMTGTE
jgi:hypothetical protein